MPVNKLYDRGMTVISPPTCCDDRIGEATIALHPDAAKNLGVEAGQLVKISFDGVNGDAMCEDR